MKIKHSWEAASRYLISQITKGEIDTLSCDVFDTLLIRKTAPTLVTDATSRFLSLQLGIPFEEVVSARQRAWNIETSKSIMNGLDAEAEVVAYFKTWIRLLIAHTKNDEEINLILNGAIEFELSAESRLLKPNTRMLDVLHAARTAGVRIVAVSDMYLTSPYISRLLKVHGFMGENALIDQVVSSADRHLQKKTGRLFDALTSSGELSGRIIHVGDDTTADGIKAHRSGLRAVVVYDTREMLARAALSSHDFDAKYASSSVLSHLSANNPAEALGMSRFGPIYAGFLHSVASRAVTLKLTSVWFLAREGWLLKELYDGVSTSSLVIGMPPSGYFYGSRLSTMRAQLEVFGRREIQAAKDNTADHSLRSVLAPLGIPPLELHALLEEASLTASDSTDERTLSKLESCGAFNQAVYDIGKMELEGIRNYLLRTGFPTAGRVGIVDVGWGGQIQENLERIIARLGWKTEIVGLYLGTDDRAEARRAKGMRLEGLISDSRKGGGPGVGAFSFVQGLELATRSQHGSVLGYTSVGDPVLAIDGRGRKAEMIDDPAIANIQLGILAYSSQYFDIAAMAGVSVEDSVSFARDVIDVLCLMPTRENAESMLAFNNVANLGMDDGLLLGGKTSILRPRSLIGTLRSTLWQEGTCAAALPFFGPTALLGHRWRKGMTKKPMQATMPEPEKKSIETKHIEFKLPVQDLLSMGLSEIRKRVAIDYSYSGKGTAQVGRFGIRDLLALAIIRRLHGDSMGAVTRGKRDMIRTGISFLYRHPAFEVAKKVGRRLFG